MSRSKRSHGDTQSCSQTIDILNIVFFYIFTVTFLTCATKKSSLIYDALLNSFI